MKLTEPKRTISEKIKNSLKWVELNLLVLDWSVYNSSLEVSILRADTAEFERSLFRFYWDRANGVSLELLFIRIK